MIPAEKMERIDALFSHIWMVRAFLKHSDEAAEDEELTEVHRELYDAMHSLGLSYKTGDAEEYLRHLQKKFAKLKQAVELFAEIQPQISTHTNFQMAKRSLVTAMGEIEAIVKSAVTVNQSPHRKRAECGAKSPYFKKPLQKTERR